MSPLYLLNGLLLLTDNMLSTSNSCCCCGCYKVEYSWTPYCNGNFYTYSGSFLFRDQDSDGTPETVCYDDPNALVVLGPNDGQIINLGYGDFCSVTPGIAIELIFNCDGTITMDDGFNAAAFQLENPMCCGESIGTFIFSDPPLNELTVTISLNNSGDCDCTEYTPV